MIIKFQDVEQSKLANLLVLVQRPENRFVTTDPLDTETHQMSWSGPSPVIFLLSSKQTTRLAAGHRQSEITLEILENHWVAVKCNDICTGRRQEKVPQRIIQVICDCLGRFPLEQNG